MKNGIDNLFIVDDVNKDIKAMKIIKNDENFSFLRKSVSNPRSRSAAKGDDNMNKKEYINKRILEHLKEFIKLYPEQDFFAICLQGSQNYDLDIYTNEYKSDVDTKIITIPSLDDIVLNKKPISTTHILPNNEHIDIKDIRLMFDNFKKQNINFLEILFTKYGYGNAKYKKEWDFLVENRELIAHYNTNQALRCMAGMSMEKKKALCHPYPTIKDKIEKYGYDGKQLHHIIRMYNFITCYALNGNFKECLTFFIPRAKRRNDESQIKSIHFRRSY